MLGHDINMKLFYYCKSKHSYFHSFNYVTIRFIAEMRPFKKKESKTSLLRYIIFKSTSTLAGIYVVFLSEELYANDFSLISKILVCIYIYIP